MRRLSLLFTLLLFVCFAGLAHAQVAPGHPNLSAYDSHEVDTVNLLNNNILLNVPIMGKAGALPFSYTLTNESSVGISALQWTASTLVNDWPGTVQSFTSSANGLISDMATTVGAGYTTTNASYICGGVVTSKFSGWYVADPNGTQHFLPTTFYTTLSSATGCQHTATAITTDSSGFTVTATGNSTTLATISTASGINVSKSTGSLTDAHGNTITTGSSWTDSMGLTALITNPEPASGSPTFQWTDVSGGTQTVTQNIGSAAFQTNFGCTGIRENNSGIAFPITTGFSFPDGTSLGITYETAPGYSPHITGRLQQLTLREGGTVTYTYGATNNGIDCTYQTVPVLTRTLGNGDITTYTLTHPRINSTANYEALNTVVDPAGNKSVYFFTGFTATGISPTYAQVLTAVQHWQDGTGATLLTTDLYSYNTAYTSTPNDTSISQSQVTYPISEVIVYHQVNGMTTSSATDTKYDAYGNITDSAHYDFGGTTPARETIITYGSCTASCNTTSPTISNAAMAANNIYDRPGEIVKKQNGVAVSMVNYTYDAVGDKTFTYVWDGYTAGFLWNVTANTYNTNGTPTITYDITNNETDYTYAGANYSSHSGCTGATQYPFPTSIKNVGTGLTTQSYYDCTGGVVVESLDPNGDNTTYGYKDVTTGVADPFWRVRSVADPNGHTAQDWFAQNGETKKFTFNSGNSVNETTFNWDYYGRPSSTVTFQSPGGSNFDWLSKNYGWSGNHQQVQSTNPCSGGLSGCGAFVHTMLYDPLGRLITASTTSNETITHTYTQNDDLAVLTAGPSVQTEYDGLGRVSKVCHIGTTASTGSGTACGQNTNTGAVGATDAYTYSQGTGYTSVSVAGTGQTRTNLYDTLGRLVQKTTPEGGTWTYVYDHVTSCNGASQTSHGNLVCSTDPNGNSSVYYYDSMNRLTDVGTGNGGSTACKRFRYDSTANHYLSVPTGATIHNVLGKLMEAETDNCSGTSITDEWFSYDNELHMTDMWEATPHSTQYYHSVATFYDNGTVNTVQLASPSAYTLAYGLDGEGRWNTLTDTTHSYAIVNGATFFPAANPAVISYTGTTPDNDAFTIDANTGRIDKYVFTVGNTPVSLTGTLTWNPSGTLASLATTDGFNAGGTMTCNDSYDSWNRLTQFDCGSLNWGQNYTYDIYDNLTKAAMSGHSGTSWNPGYTSSNHYNCGAACTYDSNGNVTGDGNNTFQWNEFSKLKSTATSGVPTCGTSGKCLTYDAFGRIVEMSNGAGWNELWLNQAGGVSNMSGATVNYTTWPAPEGSAVVIAGIGASYNVLHPDWLGNSRVVSTVSGHAITADQSYTPYGEVFSNGSGSGLSQYDNFAGITGNFNNGVTWDAPNRELSIVGRWLSPDPAGTGWNQYAYPTNPNSFNDPLGLFKCAVDGATGGILRGQPCDTGGDIWFGDGGGSGDGGGGGSGGSGFSFNFDGGSGFCDSDFMPCGLPMPGLYEQIWSDVLGLPSGLNCPHTGGVFSPLCGGVSPIMDAENNGTNCTPLTNGCYNVPTAQQLKQHCIQLRVNEAARIAGRNWLIGEGVATVGGGMVGGLVAAGFTTATETWPFAGLTIPSGIVGGALVGGTDALPFTTAGALAEFAVDAYSALSGCESR